jgi:hypothetical protein
MLSQHFLNISNEAFYFSKILYGFIVHASLIAFGLKQDEKYEKKPEICFTEIYNPMRIL